MLVHPVRGVAADDPIVPPRLGGHHAAPRQRRVPVVAQVVVVEQHAGRDGRQQPTNGRRCPGLVVEPGVLLEVLDLVDDVRIAIGVGLAQSGHDVVGGLVGVHLVADHQQRHRATTSAASRPSGWPTPTSASAPMVAKCSSSSGSDRRQLPKARRNGASGSMARMTLGGNSESSSGHTCVAVQRDPVLARRARGQVLDAHERVVVVVHAPRVGAERVVADDDRRPSTPRSVSTQIVAQVSSA